ncbi:hypothetical protein Fcan01_27215 [Folsomia candida]|uniref:Uncharacterized protein n=1 Tax=Folsomia candida TaxID=158441 RepID=A0A226CXJ7_FOLCA|nr:hypothetical protein Fcan01_27215 [Folsomia candida]
MIFNPVSFFSLLTPHFTGHDSAAFVILAGYRTPRTLSRLSRSMPLNHPHLQKIADKDKMPIATTLGNFATRTPPWTVHNSTPGAYQAISSRKENTFFFFLQIRYQHLRQHHGRRFHGQLIDVVRYSSITVVAFMGTSSNQWTPVFKVTV